MELRISKRPTLYRSKYLLPIIKEPVENGAIIAAEGLIIDSGPYKQVKKGFIGEEVDLGHSLLLPALVNAHTHIELSAFKWRLSPTSSFVSWIKKLIRLRQEITPEEYIKSARLGLKEMWQAGIGLIGDHGNTGLSVPLLKDSPFRAVFFREVIDFQGRTNLKEFLKDQLSDPKVVLSLAPHAPYTVSPILMQAIKKWTQKYRLPFSLHVAESPEEVEFLLHGKGPIKELLKERGQWPSSFVAPGLRPVFYLDRLEILDENTICVHLTQASSQELALLAKRKAKPCLCPRSNTFLGVGFPQVEEMLALGLEPCLGTDSLASNDYLSIFAEIAALKQYFPALSPDILLKMATWWGAKALKQKDMGYIDKGAIADLLILPAEGEKLEHILEELVTKPPQQIGRLYG
ncbi:amidohydrolase family protein [Thermodesulfatator indicus]